jgi:ESCRT-I complex subunit TSG101
MPYLHEWQMNTSDLRELAVWMSSLFGSEPPCYAKPVANVGAASSMSSGGSGSHRPPAYAQATTTQSVTSNNSHSSYASSSIASSNNNNNSSSSNNRRDEQQQRQRQQQIEKEIAEANLAAKVAREASLHEAQLAEQQSKLKHQHEQQVSSMKVMAISKVQYELTHGVFHNVKDDLRITLHNQKLLDYGRKEELEVQIKEGEERKEELRGLNMEMEESVKRLEEWLEIAERQQQQQKGGEGEEGGIDVDSMAIPTDTHSAQMLQLSAENAAIDDCIYFLDQSMARGNIPLDVFLKEVRKLSRRQFMAKAHLIKISQAKAMTSSSSR